MNGDSIGINVVRFVWLLILALSALMVVRRTKLPYTVALVIVGLIVGATHAFVAFPLNYQFVFLVLLPPLLFEAAIHLPAHLLKNNWKPISLLVLPGVAASTLLIGYAINYWVGLSLPMALSFGALISATDPTSVLAKFRRLRVDRRLSILLEGESLFNDGTAAVLFSSILAAVLAREVISARDIASDVVVSILGGVLIGGGIGWGISLIMARINEHLTEITLTTIAAYGAAILANSVHTSSVISVITSGIILGYYRGEQAMSATTRAAVFSFWEYMAFLVNSILFLLIGIDVTVGTLGANFAAVWIAIGVVTAARAIVIYTTGLILARTESRIPLKWQHVQVMAGLRGALAIALAFSIPEHVPGRNIVVAMTYGVVLWTLLPQGLSVNWLMRHLGISERTRRSEEYERMATLLRAKRTSLEELKRTREEGMISQRVYNEFASSLNAEIDDAEDQLEKYQAEHGEMLEEQRQRVKRRLLAAQQNAIRQATESGIASQDTARELMEEIQDEYGAREEE